LSKNFLRVRIPEGVQRDMSQVKVIKVESGRAVDWFN
jgi:hypothetical protein